nr:7-cyano-7-deazaguanine synthase [Nannocystis pusilla]
MSARLAVFNLRGRHDRAHARRRPSQRRPRLDHSARARRSRGPRDLRPQLPLRPAPRGRAHQRRAPGRPLRRPRPRGRRPGPPRPPGRRRHLAAAGSSEAVPKDSTSAGEIPSTYVPARNTLFLAYALGWAEVLGAGEIWVGVNAVDYSGYPDCRPHSNAFERLAAEATRAGVEGKPLHVRAPLISWSKGQIVQAGLAAGVDYADTVSCYDPVVTDDRPRACGRCDSCRLRREGFAAAGVPDPTRYV